MLIRRALLVSAQGLYKAGNGCLFAAAGMLRSDELQSISVDQHGVFNPSASDVDAGLSPAERQVYGQYLRQADRILLVGCGTGRDLIGLRLLGYDVTGLEPVPEVVERARQHLARRAVSARVETGLIQTANLDGRYDAVIFSNGCYSLLQGSSIRIATLSRIARHLSADGRIIVSYQPARKQSSIGRWLTRTAARLSAADWTPEPGDTFSRETTGTGPVRFHHAFAPDELARECESAGFTVLADDLYDEGYRFATAVRASS